jgi:hypothetical protein
MKQYILGVLHEEIWMSLGHNLFLFFPFCLHTPAFLNAVGTFSW